MQNYRSISCRAYLPVGCANNAVKRVQVRCQSSNSGRDYSTLDKSQLKKELQTRGLSISGGRDQLIHRLYVADNPLPPIENAIPQQPADATATEESETTLAQIHQEDPVPVKKPRAVRKKKTCTTPITLLPINSDQSNQLPESDQLNETSLLKLAKGDLQAMAAARGLAKSGTKAQIVARILEVETGETVAATDQLTAAPIAERKKRVVKKKATSASSTNEPKNSTTTTTINNEESASSTTTSTTPSKKIYEPAAPLRLNESATLKMNSALEAAATVVAALNSKRRVLEMMQETVAVAVAVTAAQNLKWKELEIEKESMKNEETNARSSSAAATTTATPSSSSPSPIASPSERRRLSPDEAAKVLEEVVRRKGTGGVGLGAGGNNKNSNNSGGGNGDGASVGAAASEVDSMKTVMAGLKARLHAQEENTEQLRVALTQEKTTSTSVAPAAPGAVAVEEKKKKETTAGTPASTPSAAPVSDDMRSAIDFALTLGKAVTIVGRGFFNSLVNKKK